MSNVITDAEAFVKKEVVALETLVKEFIAKLHAHGHAATKVSVETPTSVTAVAAVAPTAPVVPQTAGND